MNSKVLLRLFVTFGCYMYFEDTLSSSLLIPQVLKENCKNAIKYLVFT
jgi:hypothetical protein